MIGRLALLVGWASSWSTISSLGLVAPKTLVLPFDFAIPRGDSKKLIANIPRAMINQKARLSPKYAFNGTSWVFCSAADHVSESNVKALSPKGSIKERRSFGATSDGTDPAMVYNMNKAMALT